MLIIHARGGISQSSLAAIAYLFIAHCKDGMQVRLPSASVIVPVGVQMVGHILDEQTGNICRATVSW